MNNKILRIALPAIVSNITVPLLGLVDVAIVGHLGAASYIGAIAVGGMLFNMIYWIFGFLRMGTSGMTSRAYGKRNLSEVMALLLRSMMVGMTIACLLMLLQKPILLLAFHFIQATDEVRQLSSIYFSICIWGTPAVLGLYSLTGWFIGLQNSRISMYVALIQNLVNIVLSLFFVFGLKMKVEGVALGTLLAQYTGFLAALLLGLHSFGRLLKYRHTISVWAWSSIRRFLTVNSDIFLRTLCLVAVTVYFTSEGARQGDVVLAVNTLMMQLFTIFSYFMDGFAYAGEAMAGRYTGAANYDGYKRFVRLLFGWGIGIVVVFTLLYGVGGEYFLRLLTNDETVLSASSHYYWWALAIPTAGFAAFLWDGIFIGAGSTRKMLYSMLVAAGTFFLTYHLFHPMLGNHALWLAFILYLSLRGLVQTLIRPRLT